MTNVRPTLWLLSMFGRCTICQLPFNSQIKPRCVFFLEYIIFFFSFFFINLSYVLQIFDTSPPTRETILQFITNLKCKVLKNKILKVFSFGPDEYVINYVLHICYIIYKALTLNSFCPLKNALKKCEKTYKL